MFASPGAIAIKTGFFTIYWYGIILAIAFLCAMWIITKIAQKEYKNENLTENIFEIAFWALLGGIIGARIYYVLLNLGYYSQNAFEIIMLQNGGISIHGGILGGIIAGYCYVRKRGLSFFKYADLYAFGLPIGQAIGRWGNFFNSEAFGLPTNLPWGVFIPESARPALYKTAAFFHPTFLYESFWDIFIFLILFLFFKKYIRTQEGIVFFCYLILYSIGRSAIEAIRIDSVFSPLGISIAIWASMFIIIAAIIGLLYLFAQKSKH